MEYFRFTGIVLILSLPTFSSISVICLSELQNLVTYFRKLSHSDAGKPPISVTLRKFMSVQKKKAARKAAR